MEKFGFSSETEAAVPTFTGYTFYGVYKDAEFLRINDNIETILSKGYQLRMRLKNVEPGKCVAINGMFLEKNTPLMIKKTGPNVQIEDYEFTQNRLTGLVAAYAFENRHRLPVIKSSEAAVLGLTWDNTIEEKCKIYLSAVTGSEHFYDQFSFWPLICALRKLQLKKITQEMVAKIAKIKNNDGHRLAQVMMKNYKETLRLWTYFPGSSSNDLRALLAIAPAEMKRLFYHPK